MGNIISNKVCNFYRGKHREINYLTLVTDDSEAQREIRQTLAGYCNQISEGMFILNLAMSFAEYFGSKPLPVVLFYSISALIALAWCILKRTRYQYKVWWLSWLTLYLQIIFCCFYAFDKIESMPCQSKECLTQFTKMSFTSLALVMQFSFYNFIFLVINGTLLWNVYFIAKDHVDLQFNDETEDFWTRQMVMLALFILNYFVQRIITELVLERTKITKLQKQVHSIFQNQAEGVIIYSEGKEKNKRQNERFHQIKLSNNAVHEYLGIENHEIQAGNVYSAESAIKFKLIQPNEIQNLHNASIKQQKDFIHNHAQTKSYNLLSGETKVQNLPYIEKNLFQIMKNPEILGPTAQAIVQRDNNFFKKKDEEHVDQNTNQNQQFFFISHQSISFDDQECQMISIRDLTPEFEAKTVFEQKLCIEQSACQVKHEMMAPLKCVEFFTNEIAKEVNIDEKIKHYSNIISNTCKLIRINCEDLQDCQLIQNRQFHLNSSSINIKNLVNECFEIIKFLAEPKKIELQLKFNILHDDSKFIVDGSRLQQVLINLLSNAIKFSKTESKVELNVGICPSLDQKYVFKDEIFYHLTFSVVDFGIGIDQEEIKSLFSENFVTKNPQSLMMNPNSNRFGLRISQAIIKNMNGDLTVKSDLGEGTCFEFGLDLQIDPNKSTAEVTTPIQESNDFIYQSFSSEHRGGPKSPTKSDDSPTRRKKKKQINTKSSDSLFTNIRIPKLPNKDNLVRQNYSIKLFNQDDLIFIADDNQTFQEVIKLQLTELNVLQRSEFFCNGQQVIDRVKNFLDIIPERQDDPQLIKPQPIKLILLDFMMPLKNGLQTIQEIKAIYRKRKGNVQLKEPTYAILSSLVANEQSNAFALHCLNNGANFVSEKPIPKHILESLLMPSNEIIQI